MLLYRVLVKPLFSAVALESINATEKMRGTANYVAGFTSQVGYTSFFIIVCIGAVFCFRKTVFKRASYPLLLFMVGGLLLTLELSSQVQHQAKENFRGRFPAKTLSWAEI